MVMEATLINETDLTNTSIMTIEMTDGLFAQEIVTIVLDAEGGDIAVVDGVHHDISDEHLFDAPEIVRAAVEWLVHERW